MYNLLSKSIGQIAFVTPNLDDTIKTYYDKFNIKDWEVYYYGPELLNLMKYKGQNSSFNLKIGLTYFGRTRVEFIQPVDGDSIHRDFLKEHKYGVQHLGIYVDCLEEEKKIAIKEGFDIVMEGAGFGMDGDGHFAYLDTIEKFGVIYEIIERPIQKKLPTYIISKETFYHE
ncbi:MAG: VOC family protein [Sphaerochaetaceae bacterium]|nr:VOC family protein [Sphaerochaetaceae bacterium]